MAMRSDNPTSGLGGTGAEHDYPLDWTFGGWKNDTWACLCIAVGEWALGMDRPDLWLSAYKTISLIAPAEEVYRRRNTLTKVSFEDYCRCNYSETREGIFASCTIVLDIGGLAAEESVERLKQAVENLRLRQTYV